jgi:hypothetical protein
MLLASGSRLDARNGHSNLKLNNDGRGNIPAADSSHCSVRLLS